MGKPVLILILVVLLIPSAAALGIAPSSKELVMESGREEFSLRIINMHNEEFSARLEVEGDLEEYVRLSKNSVSFTSDKDSEVITVVVDIPSGVNIGEGAHVTNIRLLQNRKDGVEVSARLGLSFRLTVMKPYESAFIETNLFAPNIERGRSGNFIVQTENKGSRNAIGVTPVVDIYTPGQEKVATLIGERRTIPSGERLNFALPFNEELPNGRYFARATVIYEDRTSTDEKSFTVGSPELNIDSISTTEFRLGGVAGFNILVSSNWGDTIRGVYADVEFSEEGDLLERTRTATTNIDGLGRSILNAYWDTTGLGPGSYDMVIEIHFLDRTHTKKYEVVLGQDEARVVGAGQVITPGDEDIFEGAGVLIIIVFILVLLNAILVYKFVIKKKQ